MTQDAKHHAPHHTPKGPPMFTLSFVLILHTNNPWFDDASKAKLVDTCQEYAATVAQFHGGSYSFRLGTGPEDRKPGEVAMNIRGSIPEAPSAVAYHQVTNGIPDIELGLNNCDSMFDGADSVSCALTHEIGETIGDPGANQYADVGDGRTMRAKELCDRVQNLAWKCSTGADCSNFLLPSAFVPGAPGPWDYVSLTTGQKCMTSQLDYSNGYDIECEFTGVTQLPGARGRVRRNVNPKGAETLSDLAYARKQSPFSRTKRRGLHLT